MSGIALLLTLLLLAETLSGQETESSGAPDTNKFSLTGTVVNSLTGAPVPRALVQLYTGNGRSALTNAEGHFEFSGLQPGETSVGVEKPGYFSAGQSGTNGGSGAPSIVAVGPGAPDVVLKLIPESVIEGRITANAESAEGVPVKVISAVIQEGRKQWTHSGSAISDEDGAFHIANLPAGEYYLEVGPKWIPGAVGPSKGHESGYARVFYPSAPGLDSATPLVLAAGQRAEVEISTKLEPWYRISGTVKAPEAIGWGVQLIGGSGGREAPVRNNPETGEFETRAPAGNYLLRAQAFGPRGIAGSAELPLTVNSDVSRLQLALGPAPSIPVHIKTESSGSAARTTGNSGASLTRVRGNGMPPITMWMRSTGFVEAGMNSRPWIGPGETGKPDNLAVHNLEPGTYWVEFSRNPPWYVQSAQCGDMDLLQEPLTVSSGPPCQAIEVVLRDDGGTLKVNGTWDGEPSQGTLVLLPEKSPNEAMSVPIQKGNEMQLNGLAPGSYSVLIVDRADGLEFKNPEAMSGLMSKAAHVNLSAGQSASVNAELTRVAR